MAVEVVLQPQGLVFRPQDPTVAQELERLSRTSLAAQDWTVGDIMYVSSVTNEGSRVDKTMTSLAIGAANKLMYTTGSVPAWTTSTWPTGAAVAGDIVYASAANTLSLLAIGAATRFLVVSSGLPAWSGWGIPAAVGAAGTLLHSDGTNATWATTLTGTYTFSAAGTAVTVTNTLSAGIYTSGAHGQTLAANDIAAGTSTTRYIRYDAANDLLDIKGTTGGGAWRLRIGNGSNGRPYMDMGPATDTDEFRIINTGNWDIGVTSTAFPLRLLTGNTARVTIAAVNGDITIAKWLNVGTTTLAAAQGSAAFGLTGSRQMYFDAATAILNLYNTAGTVNFFVDAVNGTLALGATAVTTGFTALVTGDFRASGGIAIGASTGTVADGELRVDGALNHDGTTVGFYGVAPATRPSAYAITGDVADRAYDAPTVAVTELAHVVATVIRDLTTQGLLQTS